MIPLVLRTLLVSRSSGDTTHTKELHIGNISTHIGNISRSVGGALVTVTKCKQRRLGCLNNNDKKTKKNNGKNTLRVPSPGGGAAGGAVGCVCAGGVSRVDEDRP